MSDWDQDEQGLGRREGPSQGGEHDSRGGRHERDKNDRGLLESRYGGDPGRHEPRNFGARGDGGRFRNAGEREMRQERGESPDRQGRGGPDAERRDGVGAPFGQMAAGSSDSGLGGYGGMGTGGWGQPNLNAQWGQGGYAPLSQGLEYGQDGGGFGPPGYDPNAYGGSPRRSGSQGDMPHDPHHVSYHHWRNTQLSNHDRDYARWRDEQARRYDEDYGSWRHERHSAFSQEFEGWRAGRGGQAGVPVSAQPAAVAGSTPSSTVVNPSERSVYGQSGETSAASGVVGYAHGANPTLARIADGEDGRHAHAAHEAETSEADKSRN